MFRDKWILIISILLGLAAAGGFYLYSSGMAKKARNENDDKRAVATVKCVAAKVDIGRRTLLTEDMVELREIPEEAAHPDAVSMLSAAVGRISEDRLLRGELILRGNLRAEDAPSELSFVLPEGKRGITVAATITGAVGHMLEPGDRVDVVVYLDEKTAGESVSFTLLENMLVVATDKKIIGEEGKKGMLGKTSGAEKKVEEYQSVTLAATEEECVKLNLAESTGRIRLTLHSSIENRMSGGDSVVTMNDLRKQIGMGDVGKESEMRKGGSAAVAEPAPVKTAGRETRIDVRKIGKSNEPGAPAAFVGEKIEMRDVQIMKGTELEVVRARTGARAESVKKGGVK